MGGGVQDTLAAQMKRDGIELPESIAKQPLLQGNLIGYLEAFHELDTERSHGMALVRIPWSRIVQFGKYYGFDVEELVFFIRRMDDAHLEQLGKSKGNGGGTPGTREAVHRPPRPD
jgi:hypothetical protein